MAYTATPTEVDPSDPTWELEPELNDEEADQ